MKELHIILIGPPGTGKSKVIKFVKTLLEQQGIKTDLVHKKFSQAITHVDDCLKLTIEEANKIK